MPNIRTILAFIRLGRLHFLAGGLVLHCLGVMIALYSGAKLNIGTLLWGQIAITATQLMTHYSNDYFDLEADSANLTPTNWSGGSRVLVENTLPHITALIGALVMAAIAFTANLILSGAIRSGSVTFLLLLSAQILAWCYSAPPVRLHSRGLGELTTMMVFALLTPLTGYYLQAGELTLLPFLAVAPLCCIQFATMLAIEFPDAAGDRHAGKRTLVVRIGAKNAARLYVVSLVMAYALLPLLIVAGLPQAVALAVMLTSPLAAWQLWRIYRGDWHQPARWNALAFYSIVLLMTAAGAELFAFTLLLGMQVGNQ